MQLAAVVESVQYKGYVPVFSGGTSLSKGYGLIKRFSEDLDFKVMIPEGQGSRAYRRAFRQQVVEAIRSTPMWSLADADVQPGNESRFFCCYIEYSSLFDPSEALRPHLRLEVTVQPPALPYEKRSLQSFIAMAKKKPPEVQEIPCVSPVETAADKLSALTWRVLNAREIGRLDDPTLVRHLYDLAVLESHVCESGDFIPLINDLFQMDAMRGQLKEMANQSPAYLIEEMVQEVKREEYENAYKRFVQGLSYAAEGESPTFADSLISVRRILERLVE